MPHRALQREVESRGLDYSVGADHHDWALPGQGNHLKGVSMGPAFALPPLVAIFLVCLLASGVAGLMLLCMSAADGSLKPAIKKEWEEFKEECKKSWSSK